MPDSTLGRFVAWLSAPVPVARWYWHLLRAGMAAAFVLWISGNL